GRRERPEVVPRAWASPRNKKILATAASSTTRASSTVMSLPHEAMRRDELHAPHRTMAPGRGPSFERWPPEVLCASNHPLHFLRRIDAPRRRDRSRYDEVREARP